MPHLTLALLGGFAVQVDTRPARRFRSQKARALLAYLVMEAGRPHERLTLAALFWPEMSDALALRNLSQTLIWLRQAIGDGDPPFLLLDRRQIQWNPAAAADVDALRFQAVVERRRAPGSGATAAVAHATTDAYREAVALYAGEFLAGFSLSGCPAFDDWLLLQREYFRRLAVETLFRLTAEALDGGDYPAAVTFARRQLALDRWREEAVRQLLQALAALGRHSEALAEYERARRLLAQELDVAPQPETTQLAEAIRQGKVASGQGPVAGRAATGHALPAGEQPPTSALPTSALPTPVLPTRHNLPVRLTSLLGREEELATVAGWLAEPETRLVTISGIGGVGKTRLALAVAAAFTAHASAVPATATAPFPDGVWFVPLAGVADTELDPADCLVTAIAAALGLTLTGPESYAQQLSRWLRDRQLLLVLDNYEHLLATRPVLLNLLHDAPGVRALVTSREGLNLGGERLLLLEGLPLPPAAAAASRDDLLAYSAARLFFTRALERGTPLALDEAERACLVRICHLAEGLPLVIELAAAWSGHFTCAEIAGQMAANLDFLSAESAAARVDLPARQRSPRAAFDYTWRLLSAGEQRALAQLALLRDPFSREAALAVSEAHLVDLIGLLNKSLLRQTAPGWYALHSLVRQFALEQLSRLAEVEAAARQRHAAYFLGVVAAAEMFWHGPTPQGARADLRPLLDNVRQAWQWAQQHAAWGLLQDALLGLASIYRAEGLLAEALEVLRQLTAHLEPPRVSGSVEARLLSRALSYQAALRLVREMNATAGLELAQSAVDWAQWAADPVSRMFATQARAVALQLAAALALLPADEHERIRQDLEQVIAIGRQTPASDSREQQRVQIIEVQALIALGTYFVFKRERSEARRRLEEALAICRGLGYLLTGAQSCNAIAELLENEGELEPALRYREQALSAYQQINEPDSVSLTQGFLCSVLTYLGDYQLAWQHGRAALDLRRRHGLVSHLLAHSVALAAYYLGDDAQALQLVAAAREETPLSAHIFQFPLLAGQCYTRLGRWDEAAAALQTAAALAQRGANPLAVATVRGAQADLALARGDTAAALGHAEALLPLLAVAPLPSACEPLRLHWTCYRALRANSDDRAPAVLAAAQALLERQAALIQDDARRRTFREQVAVHRAIAQESRVLFSGSQQAAVGQDPSCLPA